MESTGSARHKLESPWLPLGSAQIIDWKHFGQSASPRRATVWTSRVGGEPVLLRSWSDENTTYYEFYFLAHEDLNGKLVISTSRPEQTRLRLDASVEIEGRLNYSDVSEFQEHPLTGLYGSTVRTVEVTEGDLPTDHIANLSSGEGEILEYAPESALLTSCGSWIYSVLECVKKQFLDGEEAAEAAPPAIEAVPEPPEPSREPTPPPAKRPSKPTPARARETFEGPGPETPPRPTPKKEPARPEPRKSARKKSNKLVASTNNGDQWEITDEETYIGRSKQCFIVLKSQRVSRKHATVTQEDDGFYINDLGAANGIWNGTEKIDREKIEDGSEYIIGDVLVTFSVS